MLLLVDVFLFTILKTAFELLDALIRDEEVGALLLLLLLPPTCDIFLSEGKCRL